MAPAFVRRSLVRLISGYEAVICADVDPGRHMAICNSNVASLAELTDRRGKRRGNKVVGGQGHLLWERRTSVFPSVPVAREGRPCLIVRGPSPSAVSTTVIITVLVIEIIIVWRQKNTCRYDNDRFLRCPRRFSNSFFRGRPMMSGVCACVLCVCVFVVCAWVCSVCSWRGG